jgi:site-specific DNA recombinase
MAQLNRENIRTKTWVTKAGTQLGGAPFARGHLYYLLRNRLYLGEIRHRERWYPGEHPGIVSRDLWDQVQAQLDSNLRTQGCRRWRRTPGLTMKCPNARMRRWGTRWWTAVCITVRCCDMHPETPGVMVNEKAQVSDFSSDKQE